jgi:GTP cyclohydrolase I
MVETVNGLDVFPSTAPVTESPMSPVHADSHIIHMDLTAPRIPDLKRAAAAVRELLIALGEDPDREGLEDTPKRVAKAMAEQTAGLREDAGTHLRRTFAAEYEGAVVVKDIRIESLCEHHLLPFIGTASVAYVPGDGRVVGLSKLARTCDVFARRPQVQERLTREIADAIDEHLHPKALAVRIEAEHLCMCVRGARKPGASTVTTVIRGEFRSQPELYPEVMGMLRG